MEYLKKARTLSEKIDENIENTYEAGNLYAHYIRETSMYMWELLMKYPHLFNEEVRSFMVRNYRALEDILDHKRSMGFTYPSVKTIEKNYLFKVEGKAVEDIQWMWMRIAVQVAMPDMDEIRSTYDMLSRGEYIHATPTCTNAGFRKSQLESCFLIKVDDSMDSISKAHRQILMGSKCNGGFGVDLGSIRHSRVSNRGITKGVPGLCKHILDPAISYADQLGSRPGACTVYLPIWHTDIPDFIRMKDENSPKAVQALNLNYALWIQDLFMERVRDGGSWSLFCPRETKKLWAQIYGGNVDDAPSLHDLHGKEFRSFYHICENTQIARTTMKANDLWENILKTICRIGEPFILFDDNVNQKSNHSHLGHITQSNLCTEIMQYTEADEMSATCDLATICLPSFVCGDSKGTPNGDNHENGCDDHIMNVDHKNSNGDTNSIPHKYLHMIDWERLGVVTRQAVRNLNRVLDRTSGIMDPHEDPTRNARLRHRAIGIGKMGLASLFSMVGLDYKSYEAAHLATTICACIYWHALDESYILAQKEGPCQSWYGSPMSRGILQRDMWHQGGWTLPTIEPHEFGVDDTWDTLRNRVMKGTRNSLLTCQMPNVTTSMVFGVSPSIEPYFSLIYNSSSINGSDKCIYNSVREVLDGCTSYDPVHLAKHLRETGGKLDPNGPYKGYAHLFRTSDNINLKKYMRMLCAMGQYIDQSQSANIFYSSPNYKYLHELYFKGWENGIKTCQYYLRRQPSAGKITQCVGTECTSCQ